MKAVILAGGRGTRGRPFTDYFPKAMIPVQGRPLIAHIIDYLLGHRTISEVIVVADIEGLGGQISHYFKGQKKVRFIQDSTSGTASDLMHLQDVLSSEPFVLWFVDNLGAIDVEKMHRHFVANKSLACIATRQFRREETGFAKVQEGKVMEFIEKPMVKMPDCECTGIYILSPRVIRLIRQKSKKKKHLNLSYDILQELSDKGLVSSFDIGKTEWLDIESPNIVERKKETVENIVSRMSQT